MITNGAHADIVDQPGPAVGELIEQRRRRRPVQQSTLILHIAAVTSAVLSASVDD